jgi:hypothetical protein
MDNPLDELRRGRSPSFRPYGPTPPTWSPRPAPAPTRNPWGRIAAVVAAVLIVGYVLSKLSGGHSTPSTPSTWQPTSTQPTVTAAVAPPPGAVVCSDNASGRFSHSARGNDVTSCLFAENVRAAFLSGDITTPKVVNAYSPVTHLNYQMTCTQDAVVTCRGGNNAIVYIY